MKRILLLTIFLLMTALVSAQPSSNTARHIRYGSSLPATCSPATGDVFFKTSATIGMYQCLTTNTWTAIPTSAGSGTVTSVSVVTANGVSGSVATATTTPAITLTLGAITPTTVSPTASITQFISSWSSANTSLGATAGQFTLKNTDTTNNNYSQFVFLNDEGNSAVSLAAQYTDHTSGAQTSNFNIMTRSGGSFANRATVDSSGLNLASGETFQINSNAILGSTGAATFRWGAADAASPVAQIDTVQNVVAGTSNTAGADRTYKASAGTGTGIGGSHIWAVAPAGSTGTTQNTFVNAMTLNSASQLSIGLGTTAPPAGPLLVVGDTSTSSPRGIMSVQVNTGTDGARFHLRKARGTFASPTVIVSGDTLGKLVASGYDGSNFLEMGAIEIDATGTIASTRVPTKIVLSTATDAAPSVLTAALTIDKDQSSTFGGKITVPNGLVSAPSLVFAASSNTGFWTAVGGGIEWAGSATAGGALFATGVELKSTGQYMFSSTTDPIGTIDTGLGRNAAGVVEFNSGTLGTLRDWTARASTLSSATAPITFSNAAYQGCTALTTSAGGVLTCTPSDARFKEGFNPFKNGLDTLRKIHPQTFQWRSDSRYADGGINHLGFIAQDLQQANPLLASKIGDGVLQPEQLAIQAVTVQSIKELDEKVQKLTALVETQQKEIQRLKRGHR